jgi:hypothetical protein
MDSIPIHTSLVPNEKIRCNCHRIHKRSSQHRSCVLRLYFTCLTKKRHAPHYISNIQPAKLQGIKRPSKLSAKQNELFIFSDSKADIQTIDETNNILKNSALLNIWNILLSSKHPVTKHKWCGFKAMSGPLETGVSRPIGKKCGWNAISKSNSKSSHGQCRKEWSKTITLNNQKECGNRCVTFKARLAIVVLCLLVPYL